jgi:hypothetical protein
VQRAPPTHIERKPDFNEGATNSVLVGNQLLLVAKGGGEEVGGEGGEGGKNNVLVGSRRGRRRAAQSRVSNEISQLHMRFTIRWFFRSIDWGLAFSLTWLCIHTSFVQHLMLVF